MAEITIPPELIARMMKRGWLLFDSEAEAQAKLDSVNARARALLSLPDDVQYTALLSHATDPTKFAVRIEDDVWSELTDEERMAMVPALPDGWEEVIDYGG